VFWSPQLAGGGVLVGAGCTAASYGAPSPAWLPVALLGVWPFGVVVRDTIHDVRCWHRRQRRLYAEHCQRVQDQARDQRGPIHAPAERVRPEPAGYLEAPRPAPMVIEGEFTVERES
jgi:hypothetical protein